MEVPQKQYKKQLFSILEHIANASFITFDLEMSGITMRRWHLAGREASLGKPDLQEVYREMKEAAETFQTLQLGITCVEEDHEKEFYLARPYNFYVTPLSAQGVDLKLDRMFQFSSAAGDFLLKNGFDFGKTFNQGVPYLSRAEEAEIRDEFLQRAAKNAAISDIVISPSDTDTLDFYRATRKTISAWVNSRKIDEVDFVNVGGEGKINGATMASNALNGFQRRLVYQIVRNEFPTLRTFARCEGAFMQVEKLDVVKEDAIQKRKQDQLNRAINKQKGLRWIFEALVGGDLTGIDPYWFWDEDSDDPGMHPDAIKRQLKEIINKLRTKKHVIVGHNLWTDLGFLYSTFVGPLPRNVKHFQEDIHEMFPLIIDTKYLATHNKSGNMDPRSNLKDLLAPFRKIHTPFICLAEEHNTYGAAFSKEHEAGYDSWMTAELFIKLSAKLYSEYKDNLGAFQPSCEVSEDEEGGGVAIAQGIEFLPQTSIRDKSRQSSIDNNKGMIKTRYATQWNTSNPYDALKDEDSGDMTPLEANPQQWIPSAKNKFWDPYVNKLRVNNTESGFCDLEEKDMDERLDGLRERFAKPYNMI